MPQNFEVVDQSKRQNPMLGLIGFIVFIVVAGLSYAVSGPAAQFMQSTTLVLGSSGIKLLPITFPADWPPIADQLAVAVGIFLVVFVIAMFVMFLVMRPPTESPDSVSLDVIRQEKQRQRSRR